MNLSTKKIVTVMMAVASIDLMIGTGQLKVSEHMIPAAYIPAVQDWASFFAVILTTITGVITGGSIVSDQSQPAAPAAPSPAAKIAAMLALAIGFALMMPAGTAHAQLKLKRPQITGDVVKDFNANAPKPVNVGIAPCDITLFELPTAQQFQDKVKACGTDFATRLSADTKRALDSATKASAKVAVACLQPAYEITLALVPVEAQAATDTSPAVPAQDPGPVLLFEKWSEFALGGGVGACTSWVKAVIAASTP